MPTTTNFGWTTPADTDLVKDGALAIRTLGNGIDTSLVDLKGGTTGQFLSKASNTDMDFTWASAGGKILQVISTNKTDTFSTTATSLTDLTGLSVSITPSSTNSKILVFTSIQYSMPHADGQLFFQLVRGATAIAQGDAAGSRTRTTAQGAPAQNYLMDSYAVQFLDSPNTTSSTTYKIQTRVTAGTGYVNRTVTDTDSAIYPRGISTITVMEVAA